MDSLNVQEPVSVIPNQQLQEENGNTIILPWWISVYRLLLNPYNWYEVFIPIDNCSLGYNQLIISSNVNDNNESDHDDDGATNGKRIKEIITKRYSTIMICMSLLLGIELNLLLSSSSDIGIRIRLEFDQQRSSATAKTTSVTIYYWIGCCILVSIVFCLLSLVCIYSVWIIIDCIQDVNVSIVLRSSIGQYVSILPNRLILMSVSTFMLSIILLLFQLLPIQQGSYISLILITASSVLFVHMSATISAFGRLILHTNTGTIESISVSNKINDDTLGRISNATNHEKHIRQQQQQPHDMYSILFHKAIQKQQSEFRLLKPSATEYADDATLTCDYSPNIKSTTPTTPSSYLTNPALSDLLNELSFYRTYHYDNVHQPQSIYNLQDNNHESVPSSTVRNQQQQSSILCHNNRTNDTSLSWNGHIRVDPQSDPSNGKTRNDDIDPKSDSKLFQQNNFTGRINGQRHLPQSQSNTSVNYRLPSDRLVPITNDIFPTLQSSLQSQSQPGTLIEANEETKLHYNDDDKDVINEEETISFQNYDEYYDCDVPIVEDKGVWYNGIYFGDDDDDDPNNDMRINTIIQDSRDPTVVGDDDYNENNAVSETSSLLPKHQHAKNKVQSCPRTPVDQLERGKFYLSIIQETPNVENDEEDEE